MDSQERMQIFEKMPIRQAVCRQMIPAVASQMVALVYNLADTYFVGILNDPIQTSAITIVYPTFLMLTAVSNLFGVGGASVIARFLGQKRTHEAKAVSSISFWCGLLSSGLVSLLFLLFSHSLLTLCGAVESTYPFALGYAMWVVVLGGPFNILNTLLGNLVRAEGDALNASLGLSFGGVINILLDPFFVLPQFLGLGAAGAGIATALSNMLATGYFLLYLLRRRKTTVLSLSPRRLRQTPRYLSAIVSLGLPSALLNGLAVVSVAAQSKFVSKYAVEAVAGLGIVKKLDQLPLYFTFGVSNGLLPILAYNYGAGNRTRARQAFRFGCMVSVGFAVLCLVVYELLATQLSSLFIQDLETIQYSAGFLRRMVLAMPLMALCNPLITLFQAVGRVRESTIVSILRKGVLDIPFLFLWDSLLPLYGCMWVQPTVDSIALTVAVALYLRLKKCNVL